MKELHPMTIECVFCEFVCPVHKGGKKGGEASQEGSLNHTGRSC